VQNFASHIKGKTEVEDFPIIWYREMYLDLRWRLQQGTEKNSIMRRFMICIPRQILC